MKKLLLSSLLLTGLFFGQNVQAQNQAQIQAAKLEKGNFFEQVTLEAGWGLNIPSSPLGEHSSSDLIGIGSFYVGANYKLNELWGVRGTYAYNNFKHQDYSDLQFKIHKFMAEATLSLRNTFVAKNKRVDQPKFDVIAHSGFGLSSGKRKTDGATDKLGSFQLGFMPSYRVSEKLSLNLDLTYVQNFSQASTFAGTYVDKTTGSYFLVNIGFRLALGK